MTSSTTPEVVAVFQDLLISGCATPVACPGSSENFLQLVELFLQLILTFQQVLYVLFYLCGQLRSF